MIDLFRTFVFSAVFLLVTNVVYADPSSILFILDSSGSMAGKVDGKPKMAIAKQSLAKLLSDLPENTKTGLMVYGHREKKSCTDVEVVIPLGLASPERLNEALQGIAPKGKTPIAYSLEQSSGAFGGLNEGNNNVVLISDGIETCKGDPCKTAGVLAKSNVNVRIHVVGFDISDKDRKQLECIAKVGNGKYFSADSTQGFTTAVAEAVRVAQVETSAPVEPPQPKFKEIFREDFNGEVLAEEWEINNPDPDTYIVEDGKLLIVSGTVGSMAEETVENLFKLSKPLPGGDWTITAKFSVELQSGRERAFIGIVEDGDNHLEVAVQSVIVPWGNNAKGAIDLVGVKRSKGKVKASTRRLWFSGRNIDPNKFANETKDFPQSFLMQLEKRGKSYIGSAKLEGAEEWVVLDKFTILRRLKGSVSLGLYQSAKTEKESTAFIDWVKIVVAE